MFLTINKVIEWKLIQFNVISSSKLSSYAIHLYFVFLGQPIANKVIIVAPSSLVKVIVDS